MNVYIRPRAQTLTLDVKPQLAGQTGRSGDDHVAQVAARIGLLRGVDVDGQVGGGHGDGESDPLAEFGTPYLA